MVLLVNISTGGSIMHELRSKQAHQIYFYFSWSLHTSSLYFLLSLILFNCFSEKNSGYVDWYFKSQGVAYPSWTWELWVWLLFHCRLIFSLLVDSQGGPLLQASPVTARKVSLPKGCPGGLCSLVGSLLQPPVVYLGSLPCSTDCITARRTPSSGWSPWPSPSWKAFLSHSP